MASSGVNVLRYAALLVGVGYGLSHQASITAKINQAHIDADSQHKTNLIQRAKAEWAKKTAPKEDSGIISNPDDPRFDLEAFMTRKMADEMKS